MKDEDKEIYNKHLFEIKSHLDFGINILNQEITNERELESVACQIRMALELLYLSAFIYHKERFEACNASFKGDYKTVKNQIEKRPIYFFPEPFKSHKIFTEKHDLDKALKEKDLFKEWKFVSNIIHANSPYNKNEDWQKIRNRLEAISNSIIALLASHKINFYKGKTIVYQLGNDGIRFMESKTGNIIAISGDEKEVINNREVFISSITNLEPFKVSVSIDGQENRDVLYGEILEIGTSQWRVAEISAIREEIPETPARDKVFAILIEESC